MSEAPPGVHDLARQRAHARAERDFALADRLRDEIAAAGWLVRDDPDGYSLAPKPPYDVITDLTALRPRAQTHRAVVTVLVEGWPEDVRTCFTALLTHLPSDVGVVALDAGNID